MKSRVESYEVGWQRYFTCLPHAVTLLPPVMLGDAERVVSRLCTCTHSHIILKEHSDESMSPWVRDQAHPQDAKLNLALWLQHRVTRVSQCQSLLSYSRERENSHCVTMRINSLNRIVVSSSVLCPELVSDKTRNMTETSVHISQCQSLYPYARKNSQWLRMRIKSLNRIVVSTVLCPQLVSDKTRHIIMMIIIIIMSRCSFKTPSTTPTTNHSTESEAHSSLTQATDWSEFYHSSPATQLLS